MIDGARAGGTVTVLTHDGLAGTLDPSAVSRPDLLSIDSGLLTRSTQYRYDRDTHQMMLVPDLATELGYHNDHYTRWSFTIRPGARFEDGQHVTAADVVRGVHRCLRAASSPTGPCHDLGPALTDVTSGPGRHSSVVTFSFKRPFPDLPYVAASPELGPLPAGRSHDPATYRLHPLATGPYMVDRYTPSKRLVLVRNPEWDARTDPARTQYPERYVFRSGVPARAIDRRLVSGTEPTTLTYDDVRRPDLAAVQSSDQAGLVVGGRQYLTYWAPDNRVVTDRRVRLALASSLPSVPPHPGSGPRGHRGPDHEPAAARSARPHAVPRRRSTALPDITGPRPAPAGAGRRARAAALLRVVPRRPRQPATSNTPS